MAKKEILELITGEEIPKTTALAVYPRILGDVDAAGAVRDLLDMHFHFGMGGASGIVCAGSGSSGIEFDLADIEGAELFHYLDSGKPEIRKAMGYGPAKDIWTDATPEGSGEIAFTRVFSARIACTVNGEFSHRTHRANQFGQRFVPEVIEDADMVQIIEKRLKPVFGKNGYEVLPIGDDGKPIPLDDVVDGKKYHKFHIKVFVDKANAAQALSGIGTVDRLRWSGYTEQQQNLPAPDGR